jgi:hypothetical protein
MASQDETGTDIRGKVSDRKGVTMAGGKVMNTIERKQLFYELRDEITSLGGAFAITATALGTDRAIVDKQTAQALTLLDKLEGLPWPEER